MNFEIELEQIRTVTHDRVDRVLSHLNEREREEDKRGWLQKIVLFESQSRSISS